MQAGSEEEVQGHTRVRAPQGVQGLPTGDQQKGGRENTESGRKHPSVD